MVGELVNPNGIGLRPQETADRMDREIGLLNDERAIRPFWRLYYTQLGDQFTAEERSSALNQGITAGIWRSPATSAEQDVRPFTEQTPIVPVSQACTNDVGQRNSQAERAVKRRSGGLRKQSTKSRPSCRPIAKREKKSGSKKK